MRNDGRLFYGERLVIFQWQTTIGKPTSQVRNSMFPMAKGLIAAHERIEYSHATLTNAPPQPEETHTMCEPANTAGLPAETANSSGMEHSSLQAMTQAIMDKMPPSCCFSAEDGHLIVQHRNLLLDLEDELIQGFYATIFAHEPMREIFQPEERQAREEMLRQWWQRTVSGPFDEHYWAWQTLVGLVHVKRGVKNAMMIAMWGWVINWLCQRIGTAMDEQEAERLRGSFKRLAATVQALTAESYLEHYISALQRATGFKPALLDRLAFTEIDQMLAEARKAWAEDSPLLIT